MYWNGYLTATTPLESHPQPSLTPLLEYCNLAAVFFKKSGEIHSFSARTNARGQRRCIRPALVPGRRRQNCGTVFSRSAGPPSPVRHPAVKMRAFHGLPERWPICAHRHGRPGRICRPCHWPGCPLRIDPRARRRRAGRILNFRFPPTWKAKK